MKLLRILLIALPFVVHAEGYEYDAELTPQATFTCTYAPLRTDGSPFLVEDYGNVDLFVSTNPSCSGEPYYSGPACEANIVLGAMATGQYYRCWSQWDTGGRVSDKSVIVPFFLWNIAPPNPPQDTTLE